MPEREKATNLAQHTNTESMDDGTGGKFPDEAQNELASERTNEPPQLKVVGKIFP